MAEFDVDGIGTETRKRLAPQNGIFQGLYRLSRDVTALARARRRYATRPLLTSPDDDPALAEIHGLLSPVRLDRTLDTTDGGRFGSLASSAVSVLTLANSDGSLDDLDVDVAIAGRDVRISAAALARAETGVDTIVGTPLFDVLATEGGDILVTETGDQIAVETVSSNSVLGGFGPIFTGVVESLGWSRSEVQIKVRDSRLRLERPVQRNTFAGAFGFDGPPELAGTTRPVTFGRCSGIQPVLVDPVLLVYQYHDGESRAVDAVYDGGLPLDLHATVRTYAEMIEFTAPGLDREGDFPLGSYITCPMVGCFRLAGPVERQLTADVRGAGGADSLRDTFSDLTLFSDGTGWKNASAKIYSRTAADILIRLLLEYGELSADAVAIGQLQQMATELPYEAGIYFAAGETGSVLEAAAQLAMSLGCILIRAKDGRYQLRKLAPPGETPVVTIRNDMIIAGSLERLPLPYRVPWTEWDVSFARNWSVMSETELFPDVPQDRRIILSRDAQVTKIVNNLVASIYDERAPAQIDTFLVHQGDAREVGTRHAELYTHGRAMFGVSVSGIAYRLEVMDTVAMISNRHGLEQGRNLLVAAVDEDGGAVETKLVLFG
jgi:hypothetical protein